MKARIKGTTEWKDYQVVFGPHGEFLGLETKGYQLTEEEWCKENGIDYDPDCPFNYEMHYISAILPLDAFDLPNEVDWQSFRAEAAKDILSNSLIPFALMEFDEGTINVDYWAEQAVLWADNLITKLKEKEEK